MPKKSEEEKIAELQRKIVDLIEKDIKVLSPMDIICALEGVKFIYTTKVLEILYNKE